MMSLHTVNTKVFNANNQEVIWNGIVTKILFGYQAYPIESFLNATDVQMFRSHGLNFFRVDVSLDMAVRDQPKGTPTQLNYNPVFWAKLDEIVNAAVQNGMWVSICFVCNNFGRTDGKGVGFPTWVWDGSWSPYFTKTYPLIDGAYGSKQANLDFWNTNDATANNVRLIYQTFLKDIVTRYQNFGNVLINTMNEPIMDALYPVSNYNQPAPTSDWGKLLTCFQGFIEQTIDVIRNVAPALPIIVCQGYFPSHSWNLQIRRPNVIIEDHSYKDPVVDNINYYSSLAYRFNQPFFLGEFGGIEDGGADTQTASATALTMQTCNSLGIGWAYLRFSDTPAPTASTWLLLEQNLRTSLIYYEEAIYMATFIFSGSVSAQASAGEVVTITVTKPDSTTETLTAITLADKTYSTTKDYLVAGAYKAKAHGDEDAIYQAWDSAEVPFTVTLSARTGTLVVTLSP